MSASIQDALNTFKNSNLNRNIQNQLKDGDQNSMNLQKIDWYTLPDSVTI